MGLRNFLVNGYNGDGQKVGIKIQAGDNNTANKVAGKILSTPNKAGKPTFVRWNTKETKK